MTSKEFRCWVEEWAGSIDPSTIIAILNSCIIAVLLALDGGLPLLDTFVAKQSLAFIAFYWLDKQLMADSAF